MPLEELVLPAKVQMDEKTATEFYAKFTAEPYESGYGHTVGNSLRRILLSSLEGAAVSAARVSGAIHEYSTLPGVREDVINILLNLKKLRVKIEGGGREYIYLSAKKSGVITAAQIQETDKVKVINKDLEIATVEPGGKLEIEIEVSSGRGYIPAEQLAKVTRPAGFIPVDALFSPINKVHYDVEPARVGQKTDYDRLVIEIYTDGTIHPKQALHQAAVLLSKSLHIFTPEGESESRKVADAQTAQPGGDVGSSKMEDVLSQPVELIELSSRAANCLKAAKIKTVRELVMRTDDDLRCIKNFGTKSLDEIKEKLQEMGLSLGMKV